MANLRIRVKNFQTEPDGDVWTSYCEEFDIASCGGTPEEAEHNLELALKAHFRSLDKRGVLEWVLKEKNVEFTDKADYRDLVFA
jgi:predicted RNase H-like HicB family nuclease